jgi:hypothetical protein
MRKAFTGLLGLTLIAFAGCSKQGTPGGPGATDTNARKSLYGQADDTFTLSVPAFSTSLQQGDTKAGSIGIKRARNFDEDVTLAFSDLPKGVAIDPASPVIKHGDTEAKFTIKAGDEAPVGDYKIKVTGHPTKGSDATNEFALTVAKMDSFHLSVPLLSTTLKQGETKEISVGLKRDKKFDQDVTLTVANLPTGVTVEPASRVLKAGDTDAKYTLKAADDAALGNFTLQFTGHPTVGTDASHEFRLTVAAKK